MNEELEVTNLETNEAEVIENTEELGHEEVHYKQMSPLKLVMRRFFRSRLSIVGIIIIVVLFLFAFVGPLIYTPITGWGETTVDYTETTSIVERIYDKVLADGTVITIYEQVEVTNAFPDKAAPSWNHILGTDSQGMDIFVRLMYGGRISLTIGFIVVILETIVGIIIGGIAGYFGGWVDQVLMRLVDIFNCIPTLPILLIASALIDSWNVDPNLRIYYLMVIITIFGWAGTARMVRGQILSLREQEYITATEVMGLPVWRKIFKHLIPNVMPQLIVSMTLGLGSVILYESTLSFLGLGVQPPLAAWGTMISTTNDPVVIAHYPLLWIPAGILIVLAVLGFNFIGDGLRDAMDPKSKK